MATLSEMIGQVKGFEFERALSLRPPYPPVVVQIDREGLLLVRLKRPRRGRAVLESLQTTPFDGIPGSIFQNTSLSLDEFGARLRELFERSGTRPGRASLVLPDNLAKISLIALPERPASRRQLDELVRAKMRRAVPFRLDDASLSYELVPGPGRGVGVLVVVVRRPLIERIEQAFESVGARVGLVDITTPNLLNLCRERLVAPGDEGGDTALLNSTPTYFSLVIVRDGRLIFYRCKTYALAEDGASGPNGVFLRELASSFSYFRAKLDGQTISRLIVRSLSPPAEDLNEHLRGLGCAEVESLDPLGGVDLGEGVHVDDAMKPRLGSALGAAMARGN